MGLLQGFQGSVTASGILVAKVSKWSGDVSIKESVEGPFIGGDGTTETVSVTKSIKGKLECVIPEGKDPGQTALIVAALAMGTVSLVLVETLGYTVTITTAKISGFGFDTDGGASAKLSFDYSNSGSFTVV